MWIPLEGLKGSLSTSNGWGRTFSQLRGLSSAPGCGRPVTIRLHRRRIRSACGLRWTNKMLGQDTVLRLCAAFPSTIESDVRAALLHMPACNISPTETSIGPVRIAGEQLRIPHRIYSVEPKSVSWKNLSRRQALILNALYTRHHDGHVREKHVELIVDAEEPWLPPFVIQMLGEYVVEIVQALELHMERLVSASYIHFLAENEPFFSLVKDAS